MKKRIFFCPKNLNSDYEKLEPHLPTCMVTCMLTLFVVHIQMIKGWKNTLSGEGSANHTYPLIILFLSSKNTCKLMRTIALLYNLSSIKGLSPTPSLSPTSLGIFWVSLPFLYVKTGVQIVKQIPSLIGIENVHETECHGRGRKNKQIKTPGSSLPINNLCFDRPYMHETMLYCYSPKDSKHHTCKSPPPLSLSVSLSHTQHVHTFYSQILWRINNILRAISKGPDLHYFIPIVRRFRMCENKDLLLRQNYEHLHLRDI